jgi:hypothetical protein
MMAAMLRDRRADKKLFLFDTCTGMPETDPARDLHVQGDFSDTSVESVASYLEPVCKVCYGQSRRSIRWVSAA